LLRVFDLDDPAATVNDDDVENRIEEPLMLLVGALALTRDSSALFLGAKREHP
jgi:hypothetical protein